MKRTNKDEPLVFEESKEQELLEELKSHRAELRVQNEELRRVRDDLERSRDRYYELFNAAPIGYLTLDARGLVLETNVAVSRMLRIDARLLRGHAISLLIAAHHRHRFQDHLDYVRSTGNPARLVVTFHRHDGTTFHGQVEVSIKGHRLGVEAEFFCAVVDVSKQKKAEDDLQRANDRLHALLDAAPVPIIGLDLDGRVKEFWNQAAEDLLGWSREEALGKILPSVPSGDGGLREEFLRWARSGRPRHGIEVRRRRKDGAPLDYAVYASPMHDFNGDVVGSVTVLVDRTELNRRRSEQEQILKRLRRMQKFESLAVLAGGVAHDFNNLLTVVLGNLQLAQREIEEKSPVQELLQNSLDAVDKAAGLSAQMLAFSGKGQFFMAETSLGSLLEGMRDLILSSLPKLVAVQFDFQEDLPTVQVDEGEIRQAVMSLLLNSAESMKEDKGQIEISLQREALSVDRLPEAVIAPESIAGDYVKLSVRDDGCGIPEGQRLKVFEPFFSSKFAGRGLGLAAVLGIVRGHGGAIFLESQEGEGTTVELFFPIKERFAGDEVRSSGSKRSRAKPRTVLVVDDEPAVRQMVKRILEGAGASVLTAADGEEGIEVFQANKDSIGSIYMDLTMPKMGGEEAIRRLREISQEVPIVVASGYHDEELVARFSSFNVTAYITKPFTPEVIIEQLL